MESKEFKLRFISGLWLLAVGLWLVALGGMPFSVFVLLIMLIGMYEWSQLSISGIFSMLSACAAIACAGLGYMFSHWYIIASIFFVISFITSVWTVHMKGNYRLYSRCIQGFGILYLATSLYAILRLRKAGIEYLTFLITIVVATDLTAYLGGVLIGGRRLAPKVSPNKTWSGALVGGFCSIFLGFVYATFVLHTSGIIVLAVCLFTTIISQIGDLFISMLKRMVAIKHTGSIFPGHGGVLDRFDGLLLASISMCIIVFLHILK